MLKKLVLTAAVSAALAITPAFAQQQQAQQSQGQSQGQQASDQKWAQEATQSQGAQIYLSATSIRQIQRALNSAGYDAGTIDGTWDKETTQAAQNFQRSKGLEPTGTPTFELINSLQVKSALSGQGGRQGGGKGMKWSQEAAQGEGIPIYISTAGVRQIQQALNKKGYDVGDVDGVWGQGTAKAVNHFQRANKLEPNGELDVALIEALGLSQQIFSAGQQSQGQAKGTKWTQENARSEGTPLWASPATVRQIEQALDNEGLDAGDVDGVWDQETASAAEFYQRSNSLEPTGTLTSELLNGLNMDNWMSGGAQGGAQAGIQRSQQGQQQNQQAQGAEQEPEIEAEIADRETAQVTNQ